MSGWLGGTRVVAPDGRRGTVNVCGGLGLYRYPEIVWDSGEPPTLVDGALLTRAPDDWFPRALTSSETL